jgi:hypothetical protein
MPPFLSVLESSSCLSFDTSTPLQHIPPTTIFPIKILGRRLCTHIRPRVSKAIMTRLLLHRPVMNTLYTKLFGSEWSSINSMTWLARSILPKLEKHSIRSEHKMMFSLWPWLAMDSTRKRDSSYLRAYILSLWWFFLWSKLEHMWLDSF